MNRLVVDPALEGRVGKVLELCRENVREHPTLRADALILVGSMARGEGTAFERGGVVHCLSDMEFLVASRDTRDWRGRSRELSRMAKRIGERMEGEGVFCPVEFTLAFQRYFRNVRPGIFGCDLSQSGQTVWGDTAFLRAVPPISARDIPRRDAFHLLCNRIVEQVGLRERIDSAEGDGTALRYWLLKGELDMGTSLLAFLGRHETTVAGRREGFKFLTRDMLSGIDGWEAIHRDIGSAVKTKLEDGKELTLPLAPGDAAERWQALARSLLAVWLWELDVLMPGLDPAARLEAFAHGGRFREKAGGWLRLSRTAFLAGRGPELARARFLDGQPRNMLYAQAALLYARRAGLDGELGFSRVKRAQYMPFRTGSEESDADLARQVRELWTSYVRTA
jgi:hypothetical protein